MVYTIIIYHLYFIYPISLCSPKNDIWNHRSPFFSPHHAQEIVVYTYHIYIYSHTSISDRGHPHHSRGIPGRDTYWRYLPCFFRAMFQGYVLGIYPQNSAFYVYVCICIWYNISILGSWISNWQVFLSFGYLHIILGRIPVARNMFLHISSSIARLTWKISSCDWNSRGNMI